ncbi:MAG TPA: hypothetical protein HA230_02275 [Candidatus Aenigmarchaeota archaeon]|nr:hypothetical protein [Candidatus Aenigmarchaeota archaeon]
MPRGNVKAKCSCNLGFMVVAWILMALGIWALVGGFATQISSGAPTTVNVVLLGWYFLGVLLVSLGKMAKWKACGRCTVHK